MNKFVNRVINFALGAARSTDPSTSHAAAEFSRLTIKAQVEAVIHSDKVDTLTGWTGKEIAEYLAKPLNSVTPRLAPLVRKGTIKDSGWRRDGQIVWVANV